jgi:hypothetical protein
MPGSPQVTPPLESVPARGDEVSPIARYIIGEMGTNSNSREAEQIRALNAMSQQDCMAQYRRLSWWEQLLIGGTMLESCQNTASSAKMSAILQWGLLVRENGPWDHKPIIRTTFKPADPKAREQHYHHYNGWLYFYDIWSNIHYGYVGRACGFSSSELLDGAGLEQIGSDIVHLRRPRASPGVQGLRSFDDPSDRQSIMIGIGMYPHLPSVSELLLSIESTPGLSRRPLGH